MPGCGDEHALPVEFPSGRVLFLKEFSMSMVAYDLTTQLRRQAAVLAEREPRELSFTGVWAVYRRQTSPSLRLAAWSIRQ